MILPKITRTIVWMWASLTRIMRSNATASTRDKMPSKARPNLRNMHLNKRVNNNRISSNSSFLNNNRMSPTHYPQDHNWFLNLKQDKNKKKDSNNRWNKIWNKEAPNKKNSPMSQCRLREDIFFWQSKVDGFINLIYFMWHDY